MQFEAALVPPRFQLKARLAGETCAGQGLPQRRAIGAVVRAIDVLVGEIADQGATAEEAAREMPLLIGIGADIYRQAGPGKRERRHHPERAVQPSGLVLAFDMAAGEKMRTRTGMAAIDIADPIDAGLEAETRHLLHQPGPRLHVLRRVGRPMDTRLVGTDLPEFVQVGKKLRRIDHCHVY
jgi:hypothetical protein